MDRRTDRQKDMRELIVGFRNSAKVLNIGVVNIILAGVDTVMLLQEKMSAIMVHHDALTF